MNKVLIIGPFPKPISGVSLANKIVNDILSSSNEYKASIINTSYPVFEDKIGSFSIKKMMFFLLLNFKSFKILKNDIIYITPGQTFYGVLKYAIFIFLASIFKKELIIHVHGNYLGREYQQLKGFKKRVFYNLISRFQKGIVLSDSLKNNLLPFIGKNKIYSIYNFAEEYLYSKEKKVDNSMLKIVYLSNLMEEKGIFILLEALEKLQRKGIAYEARIAGNIDLSLKSIILNKIESLKSTKYIGVVKGDSKKELLNWSNIFVLPTFYKMEGQPISILEALATKNVIISTEHAGIPDIIKNEEQGFLIKKQCSESLVNVILKLDKNKHLIKNIAKENKRYFLDNFTIDIFSKRIKKVFNENSTFR